MPRYRGTRNHPKIGTAVPRLADQRLLSEVAIREETDAGIALAVDELFGRPLPYRDPLSTQDACSYLFERCRALQRTYLDASGIALLFDVEAAAIDNELCKTVAAIVGMRVKSIAQRVTADGGTITVTLNRRGALWALAIADKDIAAKAMARLSPSELAGFKSLVDRLQGAYVIQPVSGGTLLAVLFTDPPSALHEALAEPGGPRFWN